MNRDLCHGMIAYDGSNSVICNHSGRTGNSEIQQNRTDLKSLFRLWWGREEHFGRFSDPFNSQAQKASVKLYNNRSTVKSRRWPTKSESPISKRFEIVNGRTTFSVLLDLSTTFWDSRLFVLPTLVGSDQRGVGWDLSFTVKQWWDNTEQFGSCVCTLSIQTNLICSHCWDWYSPRLWGCINCRKLSPDKNNKHTMDCYLNRK
jgi:hypothetical protein